MTNLKQVVACVLCDMVQAQHEANVYASSLMAGATLGGKVASLPAVSIGELSITLNYAVVAGEDVSETKVLKQKKSMTLLRHLARQLARLIIRKIVEQVQASNVSYQPNGYSFIDDLCDNARITDYTAQRMLSALSNNLSSLSDEAGEFDIEFIADQVLAVGEQYVLRHTDLEGLFSLPGGEILLNQIHQVLDLEVSDSIRQIIEEQNTAECFETRVERSMKIEIEADKLKEYAPVTIQSLTLKIGSLSPNTGAQS